LLIENNRRVALIPKLVQTLKIRQQNLSAFWTLSKSDNFLNKRWLLPCSLFFPL
jgi:hypothetical protein